MKMMMQIYRFLALSFIITIIYTLGSCDCEDQYRSLTELAGRYYDDNDTIVFYSPESNTYETYIICLKEEGYDEGSPRSEWGCYYLVHDQYKYFHLYRDSCNSGRYFHLRIDRYVDGSKATIGILDSFQYIQYASTISEESRWETREILGFQYEDITTCELSRESDLSSMLYSQEYGIVQYTFNQQIFSLLRK